MIVVDCICQNERCRDEVSKQLNDFKLICRTVVSRERGVREAGGRNHKYGKDGAHVHR